MYIRRKYTKVKSIKIPEESIFKSHSKERLPNMTLNPLGLCKH